MRHLESIASYLFLHIVLPIIPAIIATIIRGVFLGEFDAFMMFNSAEIAFCVMVYLWRYKASLNAPGNMHVTNSADSTQNTKMVGLEAICVACIAIFLVLFSLSVLTVAMSERYIHLTLQALLNETTLPYDWIGFASPQEMNILVLWFSGFTIILFEVMAQLKKIIR